MAEASRARRVCEVHSEDKQKDILRVPASYTGDDTLCVAGDAGVLA